MSSQSCPVSIFASKTLGGHLLRGLAGIAGFALAAHFVKTMPVLSVAAVVFGIFMLRGCPMCWTVGLVETLMRRRRNFSE